MMSTVNLVESDFILFSKGSLESILERSSFINISNRVISLTKKMKDELLNQADLMANDALRVIGYAYRVVDDSSLLTDDELVELENDLVLLERFWYQPTIMLKVQMILHCSKVLRY